MALARIRGITIELSADTTKATKALDSFEKASRRVSATLKDINSVLKLNPTSTEALTQKQQALRQQVEALNVQLQKEQEALRQLEAGEQTEKTIDKQRRLKLQIEETTAKLKLAKEEYRSFGSVAVQQLAAVGTKMETLGKNMQSAGQYMSRYLTAPIVGLGAIAVKELGSFENNMAAVGAVSQASGEDLDQMSEYARNLAATTKFTADEVTQAYHYMALAGWKPTEMMKGLEGVLNLVAASGEDLGRVSDITTDALTAFGEAADQSGRFADVLAIAMSHSNTNVDQLGDAFKYAAQVAGAMGYNIEDVAIALGIMANNGIKGSTAGSALRNILTNLANPTAQMSQALDVLGVRLDDGNGNMLSMAEVMEGFRTSLGDIKIPVDEFQRSLAELDAALEDEIITENEYNKEVDRLAELAYGAEGALKAKYAATVAGKRGMAGLLAIVSASQSDWDGMTEAIYNADGAAEEMRKTMEDTLVGQFTILKSQAAELAMEFGEALLPTIRGLVEWMQQLIINFQNLSPEQKETIAKIGAMVAAIGPLLLVGGKLIRGIGKLLGLPAKIIKNVSRVMSVMSAINPTTLIIVAAITALIAIGVALYKNWDKIKEYAIKIWTAIKDFFSRIIDGIKQTFINNWTAVFSFIKSVFSGIKERTAAVWNAIREFFSNTLGRIKERFATVWNAVREFLSNTWTRIRDKIAAVWNKIREFFSNTITRIKERYIVVFNAIREFLSNTWARIKDRIISVWTSIREWISDKIVAIRERFSVVFMAIRERLSNVWGAIKDRIVSVWTSIREWIGNKITSIKEKFFSVWDSIKTRTATAFQAIKEKITAPIERAKELVLGAVEKIKGLFPLSIGRIFSNFKLPHISVSAGVFPYGIGGKGKLPKFSVDWYKKAMQNGMILDNPTIFGMMNGKLLGAGEAGSETVVGTSSLLGMIQQATRQNTIDPQLIYQAVRQGASDATMRAYIDGRDVTAAVNNGITMMQNYNARFQGA